MVNYRKSIPYLTSPQNLTLEKSEESADGRMTSKKEMPFSWYSSKILSRALSTVRSPLVTRVRSFDGPGNSFAIPFFSPHFVKTSVRAFNFDASRSSGISSATPILNKVHDGMTADFKNFLPLMFHAPPLGIMEALPPYLSRGPLRTRPGITTI